MVNNAMNMPSNAALTRNDNGMLKISFAPPSISQGDVKIKNFTLKLNPDHSIVIKPNAEEMKKTKH